MRRLLVPEMIWRPVEGLPVSWVVNELKES